MRFTTADPWSKWQSANVAKYWKTFAKKLKKRQDLSRVLLSHFFEVAEVVLSQGGHIAFEWPKGAKGWLLPELVAFMKRHKLFMAECHGCFFGMKSSKGKPMFKPLHIATSSYRLAANLDTCRCQHEKGFKHDHAKGSETPKTAFYPEACLGPSVKVFIQKKSFPCPVIAKSDGETASACQRLAESLSSRNQTSIQLTRCPLRLCRNSFVVVGRKP